jgi:hypothetical protein
VVRLCHDFPQHVTALLIGTCSVLEIAVHVFSHGGNPKPIDRAIARMPQTRTSIAASGGCGTAPWASSSLLVTVIIVQ